MEALLVFVFIVGYILIAVEHTIHLNKTATALITGVLCWVIYILNTQNKDLVSSELAHHLASISEILFFLLGAMTIVELIDAHQGFKIITDKITSKNKVQLLWTISIITFFLSAALDNLTTAIVMVSVVRKLIKDKETRMFFAGIIIIAANSGGAWSPIGDVTTTMLWIGGQVSALAIIKSLILPSLISLIVPLLFLTFRLKGEVQSPSTSIATYKDDSLSKKDSSMMLIVGFAMLLFVPIFKTITHLPPYMGVLLGLGVVWVVSEIIHNGRDEEYRKPYSVAHALSKIDTSSILFFLGILLSIAALESTHFLSSLAEWMNKSIANQDIIVIVIGLFSAIIDNVPLVAASMGMYDLAHFPMDSKLWEFLAYCAGTGGSILIIGSAPGVAVMGMEKIDFMWFFKKFSLLALIGYFAGIITYLSIYALLQ